MFALTGGEQLLPARLHNFADRIRAGEQRVEDILTTGIRRREDLAGVEYVVVISIDIDRPTGQRGPVAGCRQIAVCVLEFRTGNRSDRVAFTKRPFLETARWYPVSTLAAESGIEVNVLMVGVSEEKAVRDQDHAVAGAATARERRIQ